MPRPSFHCNYNLALSIYWKMSLAGKTLFITGASRGIGKAIALRAARDGANIAIAAKTAEPHPKLPGTVYTAAQELEEAGGNCLPCVVDIRNDADLERAVQETVDRFGGIDILVNNASAISLTGTTETAMKRYDLMMNVNTRGTFLASKLCIPHMKKSSNPHILNISPPLNLKPGWFSNHCAYTIAKYGMSMCVLGMAEELKPVGIAVNALWPRTAIATAAVEMLGGDELVKMSRKPEIMADAAYHILTQNSKEYTGQFLIDDDVLAQNGVTDLDQYAHAPGNKLMPDYFLDDAEKFRDEWVKENTPSAGSGSSMGQLFAKIQPLINAEVIASISATYKFAITEETPEYWFLDLKNDGSAGPCEADTEADVTLASNAQVMMGMFTGKVSATSAFMKGELKIKGDIVKAMSLEKVLNQVRSKL